MDKNSLIRQLDDIVINARSGSFWEDTTIQDLEIWKQWHGKLLITKGWDNMVPFNIDIVISKQGMVSFTKNEQELNRDFQKKYWEI